MSDDVWLFPPAAATGQRPPVPLYEVTGGIAHHPQAKCDGPPCPFHAPSDHSMRGLPMQLRETGLIERRCVHGVGHPDPDSAAWMDRRPGWEGSAGTWGVHGCDGCCRPPKSTEDSAAGGNPAAPPAH